MVAAPTSPGAHEVFEKSFSAHQRDELLHEDTVVWETVIPLLLAIVVTGVLLMTVTVWWIVGH